MTEQENPTSPPDGVPGGRIWVCTHEHRHGVDAWVCESEDLALAMLAEVCRGFWDEAREIQASQTVTETRERLPPEPPDDRAAVELYFGVLADSPRPEFFQIEAQKVIGPEEVTCDDRHR
jgi:hypothetical protein